MNDEAQMMDFTMPTHRPDCPTRWGWWKILYERWSYRLGIKFEVVYVCNQWRYRFRTDGWTWGNFSLAADAERFGRAHFARALRYGNDWGLPHTNLCNCFGPPD